MSRPDSARLDDIANAITVSMRLLEIGEAATGLSPQPTADEPDVDWRGPGRHARLPRPLAARNGFKKGDGDALLHRLMELRAPTSTHSSN